jgi:hypothetical protein
MRRFLPVLICAVAACGGETESEVAAERAPESAAAARHACMADELAKGAQDDLATIESGFAGSGAPEGLTTFARAYLQHAQLRLAAYAQSDSAANHSRSAQDSTRHAQAAAQMQIVPPAPGSLEANVMASYDQKAAAILADADHPCNWKHELEGG